jgi:LacI family transcriptional regulator
VIGERAAQALDRMLDSGGGAAAAADATVAPVGVVPRASSRAYPTTDSALAPALRHIREQLAQPLAVPDLARRCDLSLRWFGVRFRRAVGRTPAAEIARLRLELAKSLLADTDTKITRIHAECGFTRYSYFARVFRQTTGFTPLMFRRRFQRSSAKGDSPVAADG